MCSLYEIPTPKNQLKVRFRLDALADGFEGGDVRPTGQAPVIHIIEGQRLATLARWGLIPSWSKDEMIARHTFNARAETVPEKPSFRSAFKRHRCIVPAAAFYEWRAIPGQTKKQRLRFEAADGQPLGFAGLRERWKRPGTEEIVESFTIITTAANNFISQVHDRMPALLSDADMDIWLDPEENNPLMLSSLLKPADEDVLKLVEPESPSLK